MTTRPTQPTRTELTNEASAWLVGGGVITVALFPLALPALILTMLALIPFLAPAIVAGLLVAVGALSVRLFRGLARRAHARRPLVAPTLKTR
jgi:hypothetical protein